MPAVPVPVRRDRAAQLRTAGAEAARAFLAGQVGRVVAVLAESETGGHSEHFAPVRVPATPGQLLRARVTEAHADHLLAEPA
jgi:threonylcarbamoyladenosine tRNA methylthiotransferase MtaB